MHLIPVRQVSAHSLHCQNFRSCPPAAPVGSVCRIARDAHVKRLVIGHYSARYEDLSELHREAEAVFPGTILGNEGTVIPV